MLIKNKLTKKLLTAAACSVLLLLNTVVCFGQSITWQREFPEYYGFVNKVQQTNDFGYIAIGSILLSNEYKIRMIKINAYGDTLWTRIFGTGYTRGNWIEETSDRGFIIGGSIDSAIGTSKVYLLKTDSLGNLMWHRSFSNSDLDQCWCVKQTPDGGYILSCRTALFGSTNAMFIKTDQSGNLLWKKTYGNLSNQIVNLELQILQDGYIVTGRIGVSAGSDAYLMRLNLNGDTLWTKRFGGNDFDLFRSIAIVPAPLNGFILGGTSRSFSTNGNYYSYIVKIDNNGNVEWQRTYSSNGGYDECASIIYKPMAGYVMAGASDSLNNFVTKAKLRKIDFSGDVIFETSFLPGKDAAVFNSIGSANDGGFILGGYGGNNYPDYYIVKTDSLGFANPIGIINQQSSAPINFVLHQNYPNPFNPNTVIKFDLKKSSFIKLSLFDITGKETIIISNEYRYSGNYSYLLDASKFNFSSGVYFYTLFINNQQDISSASITKKMIYIK